MFTAILKARWLVVTVYAVDFNHDAMLIGLDDKFKWVQMDELQPI
jgi:hypothetical protein